MGKKSAGRRSVRLRRAAETNEAVERIIASTNRLSRDLADIPQASDNVRRLCRGEPAQWNRGFIAQQGVEAVLAINDHVSRNAVVDIWRRQGRVAYDLNPEMAANLYRADLKGKLPGGLFQRLPHISPLVPLPRPWPFRSNNGTTGLIRAYFLTGIVGRESFCPTTDKRSEGLAVMPWIEWEGAEPAEPDDYLEVASPLFVLPPTDDPFTLDDVLDRTGAWHKARAVGGEMKMVRQILPGFMSVMTYLCCDNRDMEEPPAARGTQRKQGPPRDPFYVRVGWHIGPKLHAQRIRASQSSARDGVSVPSGVEYGPQHRAGHYKTVHHGTARSRQSLRWVDPYWTKLELLEEMQEQGQEPGTGIIPVEAQHKDPSSHRDVTLSNLGRAKEKEIREREAQRDRQETWDWE